MAANFISVDTTTTTARFSREAVSLSVQIRSLIDLLEQISSKGAQMNDGTDYTLLETLYGLPTGTGQTYLSFVNGSLDAIKGVSQNASAITLMNRVG